MTQLTKRYDRFTDTSLFHCYDRAPGVYLPEHVTVQGGKLRFDVDQSGGWGGWFGDKYLYPGVKVSFGLQSFGGDALTGMVGFLWPTSDVWSEGEFDFPEGDFATTNVHGYLHSMVPGHEAEATEYSTNVGYGQRHLYAIEWLSDRVRLFCDGTKVGEKLVSAPAAHRFTFQSKPQPGSAPAYALVDTVQFEVTV